MPGIKKHSVVIILALILCFAPHMAWSETASPFRFEDFHSITEMSRFLAARFPAGTPREELRKTFVEEGKATLKIHPDMASVEKYLYDINLCRYYIWRWNISADFDAAGKLTAIYMNGNHGGLGQAAQAPPTPGAKAAIYKVQRPRPEADKGEKSLGYLLYDPDSNPATRAGQKIIGGGPSQPDPVNMGNMVIYKEVDPWRSIFDSDAADTIVPYSGDCTKVDAEVQARRNTQTPH